MDRSYQGKWLVDRLKGWAVPEILRRQSGARFTFQLFRLRPKLATDLLELGDDHRIRTTVGRLVDVVCLRA